MAKKILIVLFIFMFIAPTMSFACSCESFNVSEPSGLLISSVNCDCCKAMSTNLEPCDIGEVASLHSVLPGIVIDQAYLAPQTVHLSKPPLSLNRISLPIVFFETPLYLAHQVLRL